MIEHIRIVHGVLHVFLYNRKRAALGKTLAEADLIHVAKTLKERMRMVVDDNRLADVKSHIGTACGKYN